MGLELSCLTYAYPRIHSMCTRREGMGMKKLASGKMGWRWPLLLSLHDLTGPRFLCTLLFQNQTRWGKPREASIDSLAYQYKKAPPCYIDPSPPPRHGAILYTQPRPSPRDARKLEATADGLGELDFGPVGAVLFWVSVGLDCDRLGCLVAAWRWRCGLSLNHHVDNVG